MLISIDVGIKNLAMCFIDSDTKRIIEWEVASVPSERQGGLLPALKEHLDRREWLRDAKTVVIERQPDRNKKMKAIEHYLHGFFCGRGLNTIVFDAKYKIPDVVGPGRNQYIKRKNTHPSNVPVNGSRRIHLILLGLISLITIKRRTTLPIR